MSKSLGNIEPLHEALDAVGRRDVHHVPAAGALREPGRLRRRGAGAGRGRRARRCETGCGRRPRRRTTGLRPAVCEALDDDFNTPRALALLFDAPPDGARHRGRGAGRARAGRRSRTRSRRRPSVVDLARERGRRPGRAATSRGPTRSRDEIDAAGWEVRDTAGGFELYRRMMAEVVYGHAPGARGAARPARGAARSGAAAGRRETLDWLPGERARSMPADGSRSWPGSPDHQGVVAEVAPYPYADAAELLARRAPAAGRARRGHRPAQPGRGRAGGRVRPGPTAC